MIHNSGDELIRLRDVTKIYKTVQGALVTAVDSINFDLDANEFITIVGPSGSGKSTILHLVAGIEKPSKGTVEFLSIPTKPKIGFVFQSNTIFPWRTVEHNLSYPLEIKGASHKERLEVATKICQAIGLNPKSYLHKYPKELSGGEQRRVAVGMALTYRADILLLDEPTSQLDYIARLSLHELIVNLWKKEKFGVILVTHDLDEAISLGQRVLILDDGKLKKSLKIELPYPRNECIRNSKLFTDYKEEIISLTSKNTNKL